MLDLTDSKILKKIGFTKKELVKEDWRALQKAGEESWTQAIGRGAYLARFDLVRDLVQSSRDEGLGHRYLVPHSAGSGKSNSIAWTAHQLSSLYNKSGDKVFHSVVVVTDRTLLDDQSNLSYYAFTATPKPKTLELFGRLPNPDQPPSKQNKPKAFHVYSMRQAIEEGYITIDYPKSSSRT